MNDITLRLDRATAEDLYATLHEVGAHFTAGAPMQRPANVTSQRLDSLLAHVSHALGRPCSPNCTHLAEPR